MDRRTFISSLALAILVAPLAAEGQQPSARIGFIGNQDSKGPTIEAFRRGLRDLGWIEGQNLLVEYRWAEGNVDRFPLFAAELVRLKVDAIVASGPPALQALRQATSTIPIVCAVLLVDPVELGFAQSLARPGGNLTGLASQYEEIVTKHVQLLAEAVPKLSRVALLRHAASVGPVTEQAAAAAAAKLGLKARVFAVSEIAQYDGAFRAARDAGAQALLVLPSPIFSADRRVLIELAGRYRLPAFHEHKVWVEDGGLMSYGPSLPDMFRRAASYVDRILKGAKPGDLPIERPTRFELVINNRTAKALGLTIPPSIMIRADHIIE